jgi:hypothetical protein
MRSESPEEVLGFSAALNFINVVHREALESQNTAGPWSSTDDSIVSTIAATDK